MSMLVKISLKEKRVVNIVDIDSPEVNLSEKEQDRWLVETLSELYRDVTGEELKYKTLSRSRKAVLQALDKKLWHEASIRKTPTKRIEAPRRNVTEKEGPVAIVRRICNEMAGESRKNVIEACARAGVKRSTAATQYQRWKQDQR